MSACTTFRRPPEVRSLAKLLQAVGHTLLLFAMPWVVGLLAGMFVDVTEVQETADQLAGLFVALSLPLFVAMVAAIVSKVRRDLAVQRAAGATGVHVFAETVERHARVLTRRGVAMLIVAGVFVVLALAIQWAQFGVIATFGIGLVYAVAAMATVVSAFYVHSFDERVRRASGRIQREAVPSLVNAGDPVEQQFHLEYVPVPPGFQLHIQDDLPERLGGETRLIADARIRRSALSLVAPLTHTPRGEYHLGPARLWFEDLLGLTQVHVAVGATAHLRVLPRFRSVRLADDPRTHAPADGPVDRLHRLPTDDWFHLREYIAGDDARRVHWKRSVQLGALHIRRPETVPLAPREVCLVLDTYLPASAIGASAALGDALDLLVEGWLSLARAFVRRGESVTLITVAGDPATGDPSVQQLPCRRGSERQWRALGARVRWQADQALGELPLDASTPTITFTAGFDALRAAGSGSVLVSIDPAEALPERPAAPWLRRALFHTFPTGSLDNRAPWAQYRAESRAQRAHAALVRAASLTRAHVSGADGFSSTYTLSRRGAALELS